MCPSAASGDSPGGGKCSDPPKPAPGRRAARAQPSISRWHSQRRLVCHQVQHFPSSCS